MEAVERIREMEKILQGAKPVLQRLDAALDEYAALREAATTAETTGRQTSRSTRRDGSRSHCGGACCQRMRCMTC